MRTVLNSNLNVYVDPSQSDANSGLSPAFAKASMQAAYNMVRSEYDLAGFTVTMNCAQGVYPQGLVMTGPLVGQASPSGFSVVGSGTPASQFEDCMILPTNGNCISAAFGAYAAISGFMLNASHANPSIGPDELIIGQDSIIMIAGANVSFGPAPSPANHITIAFGGGLSGSIENYSIWCMGWSPQCHIDAEAGWCYYNTNGQSGLLAVQILDQTPFTDSFVHCAGSDLNIQAVSWQCLKGNIAGKTCIVEKCGVIDTGTSIDFAKAANPNYFPGTVAPVVRGGGVYC